ASCGRSHATRLRYALPGGVALWAKSRRRPKAGGHSPKGLPRPARSAHPKGETPMPTKNPPGGGSFVWNWQPRMDSNHRMPESESGALPLGDGAMGPSLMDQRFEN